MSELDGNKPLSDDEFLYRRVPEWQDLWDGKVLGRQAFGPSSVDDSGISLTRSEPYSTPEEEASRGEIGKEYFVAVLKVKKLRAAGIEINLKPVPGNPGHVELPEIRRSNKRTAAAKNLRIKLARELTLEVKGPFKGETPPRD